MNENKPALVTSPSREDGEIILVAAPDTAMGAWRKQLESLGFAVCPLPSLEQAAPLIARYRPAALVIGADFGGPRAGIAFGRFLQRNHDLPVVYLVPDSDAWIMQHLLVDPKAHVVFEPIVPNVLKTFIRAAIRRQAQEVKTQRENRHLTAILSSIGDAVITVNRQLQITFMNREATHLTEHEQVKSIGRDVFSILEFPDQAAETHARQVFQSVLEHGIPSSLPDPTALIGKYGSKILIGDSVAPIVEEGGATSGLVIVFRSVADREATRLAAENRLAGQVQSAWQESQRRDEQHAAEIESLLGAMSAESPVDGPPVLARELMRPPLGASLSGIAAAGGLADSYRVFRGGREIAPQDMPALQAALTGQAVPPAEFEVLLSDGTRHTLRGSAVPLRNRQQQICGALASYAEVSARPDTEAAERRSQHDLEQFALSVSQELAEPLRTVSVSAQRFMQKDAASRAAHSVEFAELVRETAAVATQLAYELMEFSRAGSAGSIHLETLEAGVPLKSALRNLWREVQQSGAEIVAGAMPVVVADAHTLTSVFETLISNSLRFRHPNRRSIVRIDVEKQDTHWHFTVRDNGLGFDPAQAGRLFGAFQRLHGPETSGRGISLATCKAQVHQHGGRIWADGKPDEGATFHFTLPG